MKSLLSGQTAAETTADNQPDSKWQKTPFANLLRYKPSKTYFARIRVRGKLIRRSLETQSLTVGKMRLSELEKKERQIADSQTAVAGGKMNFGDALAAYRIHLQGGQTKAKKPRSKAYREERIQALLKSWPTLEKTDVRKISKSDCLNWAAGYQATGNKGKPVSATNFNNTKDTLKLVLDIAIDKGARYDNPAKEIKRTKIVFKRKQLPSQEEFQKVLAAIKHKTVADLIQFAAFSGMRISEIRNVTWQDVDFAKKQIAVYGDDTDGTKNGEPRRAPMIPEMKVLLERLQAENPDRKPTDSVMSRKEFRGSVKTVCAKLGVPYFNHHAMRHLFITRCMELGLSPTLIADWVGHKDKGVTILKNYSHVRPAHSAEMADKVTFANPVPQAVAA
jgi:integrase